MTVFRGPNLTKMWEACENLLACLPVVEGYLDEIKILRIENPIYLDLKRGYFPESKFPIMNLC